MSDQLKTVARASFTVSEIEDLTVRVQPSTTNFLVTCSSDLTSFNFDNAKTKLLAWVGDRLIDSKYLKVKLIKNSTPYEYSSINDTYSVTTTGQVGNDNYSVTYGVNAEYVEVDNESKFTGLIKLSSFSLSGLTKAELISSSFDIQVSFTDEALLLDDFKTLGNFSQIITLSWNMMPAGSSGYAVNLSRGTNCIIYSDSLTATVTQAQLDSMLNKITASSYEYDLSPFTEMETIDRDSHQ